MSDVEIGTGEQATAAKRKKTRYQYPEQAVDATDALSRVIFFGRKLKSDERDALLRAEMSMTMEQVSQLDMVFHDPEFKHLGKNIFEPDIPVKFEDYFLDVASVEVGGEQGQPVVGVRCRPRLVRRLKKRTGTKVLKDASPSDFVKSECEALGAKYVVQDSPERNQVARDTKREKGDPEPPSSWTTFKRLAAEVGFVCFEAGNVIYFAKPSWLLERGKDNALEVNWKRGDEKTRTLTLPRCVRTEDTEDGGTTIDFTIGGEYGRKFRPGKVIKLGGIPGFGKHYIITSVSYSLLRRDNIATVTAGTPVDPKKTVTKSDRQPGRTSSLRYLLQKVGFKDNGLDIAIAVAMAVSKADAKFIDKRGTDNRWGPHVGLYGIRSLKQPGEAEGIDRLRDRAKLLDAKYNAEFVHKITNGGKNWLRFKEFTDGTYKKYTKKDYQIEGWSMALPKPKNPKGSGEGSGGGGHGTAGAFVTYALRQAGDAYVFGAEASGSNPSAFDCSELVEWAARQAGVYIPDGSSAQIAFCSPISVSAAINTRGALLWHEGHIAISLGNGRTIEAANPGFGVGSLGASGRFARGGLIPGMRY
jgi:cell wall-associated NlpC family hydrolase